MRILVFGAGAIGQAAGCLLAADGHDVDLVLRDRFREAISRDGLAVTGIFGDFRVPPDGIGVYASPDALRNRRYEYVLVTVKSYDTGPAADALGMFSDQSFVVVSIQNGCGNMERFAERFGAGRTLAARVITGFAIERPGMVRITVHADDVHIGGPAGGETPASAVTLAGAIAHAGLPCVPTPHVNRDLIAKLLYNSALNPLGAVLGVHYGALGDDPASREIMDGVIGEVFAVIHALGAETHWNTPGEYRDVFYSSQLPATYNHRSSMLQDLEAGKRTEIEALTGYVSAQGRRCGVPTPLCDTLSNLVRFLERGKSASWGEAAE